jgi:hypothetical protein
MRVVIAGTHNLILGELSKSRGKVRTLREAKAAIEEEILGETIEQGGEQ